MTPDELFHRLQNEGLTIDQIRFICNLAIESGGDFKNAAYYILDEIINETP